MSVYEQDRSTKEQAKEKAQDVAGAAQERAQQAAGKASDRIREQVDQRSTQAGERVSTMAGDARSVGEELRRQGKDGPARLADQAAERAEQVGGYLQRLDGDTLLRDVEDFGRQRPWAVVIGGLAAGIAASRFLKASASRRYDDRWSGATGPTSGVRPTVPTTSVGPTVPTGSAGRVTGEPDPYARADQPRPAAAPGPGL